MRGGVNYAALNAKIAAAGSGGVNIAAWLPHGCLRDFVNLYAAIPARERGIGDYLRLWRRTGGLDSANARAVKAILGPEIDLRNIIWLYRLKTYHGVTGDTAFSRLVPLRWRLSLQVMHRMAAPDTLAIAAALPHTVYSRVFIGEGGAVDFTRPEHAMEKALRRKYTGIAKANTETVAAVCAYLFVAQTEVFTW